MRTVVSQGTLRVTFEKNPLAAGMPVRKHVALEAKERHGAKVAMAKKIGDSQPCSAN